MSIIFVFVGQCGNQVGAAVAKKLAENCAAGPSLKFPSQNSQKKNQPPPMQQGTPYTGPCFGTDGYFRSVLVDCEPKVVDSVVTSCAQQNIFIRPTNCVTGRSGRGNSWSLGYCGLPETDEAEVQGGAFRVSCQTDQLERDRTVLCRALKAIHAETRRCDDGMVEAIVVLHSMAGGTGSGLGCALVENIRHHFCSNAASHDGEDNLDLQNEIDDLDSGFGNNNSDPNENDAVAQFFMRRDDHVVSSQPNKTKKTSSAKNKKMKLNSLSENDSGPPPSILPEDMIREGTYGEPRKARFVLSVCVAPLVQGELAVQSINASLTLRTVVKNCDAVVLLRNDCQKIFTSSSVGRVSAASGSSNNSNKSSSSFEKINAFFATLLVSALQGGNSYGCVGELLEASVTRVAGDDLDWDNPDECDDDEDEDDQDNVFGSNNNTHHNNRKSSQQRNPIFGPRLLTLIPWEPRAAWAAGFRHSSVTATLVRNGSASSSTVGQQHDPQLLQAYLCNEVKGLEDQLCTILDRELQMKILLKLRQEQQDRESASSAAAKTKRSTSRSRTSDNNNKIELTKKDEVVLDLVRQQQHQMLVSSGSCNNYRPTTNCSSVLVLNQSSELTSSILSSFFRDAAAKVDTGAYMHTFNTRGILEQVFSPENRNKLLLKKNNNNRKAFSTFGSNNNQQNARRVSPRRSAGSEERNTEFARQFVNSALVDLLEYITESFPGM